MAKMRNTKIPFIVEKPIYKFSFCHIKHNPNQMQREMIENGN